LARIRDEFHLPMLYVTHDRFETLALADEIIVLLNGKIAQTGSVQEVFNRPPNPALADLLAIETVQPGRIVKTENALVTVVVGSTMLTAVEENLPANAKDVWVCIRAEDVILVKGTASASSARNYLAASVQSLVPYGQLMRVEVDCGFTLTVLLTNQACDEMALKNGDRVVALVKAPHVHLIPR